MNEMEYIRALAERVRAATLATVEDLSEEQWRWQPAADANPISWLIWHIGEVEESLAWAIQEVKQPFFRFGHSALRALRMTPKVFPPRSDLLRYLADTRRGWLELFPDNLEETLSDPWNGRPITYREALPRPALHEIYHQGQIAYIRRLLGHPLADANAGNPFA